MPAWHRSTEQALPKKAFGWDAHLAERSVRMESAHTNKDTITQTLNIPRCIKTQPTMGAPGNPLETYQPMAIVYATETTNLPHVQFHESTLSASETTVRNLNPAHTC
jgi:hypothetical protein